MPSESQLLKQNAFGVGVASVNSDNQIIEARFLKAELSKIDDKQIAGVIDSLITKDLIRKISTKKISIEISLDAAPKDVADVYLRLHLLSMRKVKPNQINLDGVFGILPNLIWSSIGPCQLENFEIVRAELLAKFPAIAIYGVDKFPRMIDYVIPDGVRIADGNRVRLGAYLSSGTTVMHEGFVNFNAGTLGKSMVEGRISAGVVVGDGTDIGGGASIMGTLSGGGKEKISVGERTLLGANSGLGISLGNDCVVEAGLYLTAGSKVMLPKEPNQSAGKVVKAVELSGANNLLFRRNSQTGAIEALPKSGSWQGLNSVLHQNQ
ncbi:MAG: 2,3,4,5-tetrahydropyridine-2-carboxylate N-succinyltransferase [Actinomycetota bacterium]|jgi:2,3,4,5-tetrahydropyridine-2-carboxylate N-succinyltransferase